MNLNDLLLEGSSVDYKEALETKKPRSWLKSISAFANSFGGHIVFGVRDNPREVCGLDNPQEVISKITELIKARIDPTPRYQLHAFAEDDKICIDLEIQNGPAYPYYYRFEGVCVAYIRNGDQSEEVSRQQLSALILKGMNKTFDALPSPYHMGDVSFTLLAATFKNALKEDFHPDKDLFSTTLVTEDGQVTNGGLLLCDQGVLPQSRIFCTRWKGTHKGNIDADALDDKEYQGASLISLLQNAEDFIRNNSKNPWSIRGMTREERSDYPYKAVREVLVNALIHRDYQVLGSEIHIEMFDDRMEISSPGGMANGRRIQDMDLRHIPSMRRNQVISDVFSRLHYMERRGSGIDRIMTSYAECAQKPVFYSDSTFFLVTLPNRSVAAPAQLSMESENVETSTQNMETTAQNVETSPQNEETLRQLRSKAIKELGVCFSSKALFQFLCNTCHPRNFMSPYNAEKVEIANKLYAQVLEKAYNIEALENIQRSAKQLLGIKEFRNNEEGGDDVTGYVVLIYFGLSIILILILLAVGV